MKNVMVEWLLEQSWLFEEVRMWTSSAWNQFPTNTANGKVPRMLARARRAPQPNPDNRKRASIRPVFTRQLTLGRARSVST